MEIRINENLSQKDWDDFVNRQALDGGFLQSWNWGEFQKSTAENIFRLAIMEKEKIKAVTLLIKRKLPLGQNYFYSPRGPITSDQKYLETLWLEIKKLAQKEKAIFVRLDPAWTADNELKKAGMKFVGQVQPKKTLILDLSESEEKLLSQMKPKTRYNIKVASKHGVRITTSKSGEFEVFWEMMVKTCQRDGIRSHAKGYYLKQLKMPEVRLVLAQWQNKAIAGAIMATFGRTSIYLHGASDYEFRDKMAPYLLQWEMIKKAKVENCQVYDFWGVDEKAWPGVTRFKIGFAPNCELTEYAGAYDLILDQPFYFAYQFLKKIL